MGVVATPANEQASAVTLQSEGLDGTRDISVSFSFEQPSVILKDHKLVDCSTISTARITGTASAIMDRNDGRARRRQDEGGTHPGSLVHVCVDDCCWLPTPNVLSDEQSATTWRLPAPGPGGRLCDGPRVVLVTARPQRVDCPGYPAGWPGCTGPIRYGRIISLSSCSTMWQCQTNWPGLVNFSRSLVTWPG
jgi:hypothetical protein